MSKWKKVALWKKILIGVVIGLIIGLVSPKAAEEDICCERGIRNHP